MGRFREALHGEAPHKIKERAIKTRGGDMNTLTRRSVLNGASISVAAALAGLAGASPSEAAETPAAAAEESASGRVYKAVPQLGRLREDVFYGDVWKQPEMNARDRSIVTCAILATLGRDEELQGHVRRAIANGVTADELRGMAAQIAFYAGWPAGLALGKAALPVLETKK